MFGIRGSLELCCSRKLFFGAHENRLQMTKSALRKTELMLDQQSSFPLLLDPLSDQLLLPWMADECKYDCRKMSSYEFFAVP